MIRKKVLLIGWDAADWKVMNPLIENGEMPCVANLIDRGVMGNLATLKPVLSPMLWNSIATGKRPDKHGILGFTELNPHTGTVSPSLSTSRKVKALWNMCSQEGLKAHVVNWFASHPAEEINGICVAETYSTPPKTLGEEWKLAQKAIHPRTVAKELGQLRIHPTELDGDTIQMFCPLAHRVDQTKDIRIGALAKQIAEAINVHTAATYILENEDWDFVGVYHGAIDHFCHLFMDYHPPQRPNVSDEDFEIYKDVVNNCYRFHDVMLKRMLELAGDDATVIICSDHGFRSDHLRPPYTPMVPAGPAYWHRDQGVIMMAGPGIKKDELVHGATLLDIAPTTLALMGLPVGRDMDGRVLVETFDEPEKVGFIDSWESRVGEHPDGMHSEDVRMSIDESQAILDQFVALGYIDAPDEDTDKAAVTARREASWNLAQSHIDGGYVQKAIPLLADIVEDAPERKDIVLTLANCLQGVGLGEEAERITLVAMKHDVNEAAVAHTLAEIALTNRNPEKALEYIDKMPHVADENQRQFTEFYNLGRWLTLGGTYLKMRNWEKALECFNQVLELDPDHVRAVHGAAEALLKLRHYDEALDYALRSVELEYRSFLGHFLLGVALARKQDWRRAEQAFTLAIRFRPGHIDSFRLLAIVYKKLERENDRQNCLATVHLLLENREKAINTPKPEYEELKERMKRLVPVLDEFYAKEAVENRKRAEEAENSERNAAKTEEESPPTNAAKAEPSGKEFLIVSGLPRSGTSLMMQMLHAGGLPVMTDRKREADIDNPEGYFEWEDIKKLKSNPELLAQAEGKAIKVISMLLSQLPLQHDYKIIFLMRPIEEVVASQQKMIARLQTKGADLDEEELIRNLTRHRQTILTLLRKMPAEVFMVKYEHLINRTENVVNAIQEFVGDQVALDTEAMRQQVRPELWRNRLAKA